MFNNCERQRVLFRMRSAPHHTTAVVTYFMSPFALRASRSALALAPALGWHFVLGEAIIRVAVTVPASVLPAINTRSAKVLDAACCEYLHGWHGPKWEPFWRVRKQLGPLK